MAPVPAVRAIVSNSEGRVLILRRANSEHGDGQWCLPGGKVDVGKTAQQAVIDELAEETGLLCANAEFLFYADSLPSRSSPMHCIVLYFRCVAEGEVRLNSESSAYAWIDRSEITRYDIAFRNDEALERFWSAGLSRPDG